MDKTVIINYLDYGARMYEPLIGRWGTVDPMEQKYYNLTPYNYCGNNPVKFVDKDGSLFSPFYDSYGNFLGTDRKGFSGPIYITTFFTFLNIKRANKPISDYSKDVIPLQEADISAKAYSKIYTDIINNGGISSNDLIGNAIAVKKGYDTFNQPSSKVKFTMASVGIPTKISVNQIEKTNSAKLLLTTVENIQNLLISHEFIGHGVLKYGDYTLTHYKVYELQMADPIWSKTTMIYKREIFNNYLKNVKLNNPELYRKNYNTIIKIWKDLH